MNSNYILNPCPSLLFWGTILSQRHHYFRVPAMFPPPVYFSQITIVIVLNKTLIMSTLLKLLNGFLFLLKWNPKSQSAKSLRGLLLTSSPVSPYITHSLLLSCPASTGAFFQNAKLFPASGHLQVLSFPGILFLPTFHWATLISSSDSNITAASLEKLPNLNQVPSGERTISYHLRCFTEYSLQSVIRYYLYDLSIASSML